jgi:hypothetical protein
MNRFKLAGLEYSSSFFLSIRLGLARANPLCCPVVPVNNCRLEIAGEGFSDLEGSAMKIPVIRGLIDRRILVNFQVMPDALARILPPPFRPRLVNGVGMAGICLIRLKHIRPRLLPAALGISSENAAHRIAVEWYDHGRRREGVYIPRRDTSSRFNTLVGGRLFPGEHHHARFQVDEKDGHYRVAFTSDDGKTRVAVQGQVATDWPAGSIFRCLEEASDFFGRGSVGYSATSHSHRLDGLELRSFRWHVEPLALGRVESSFFADQARFPPGTIRFDCALLMRGIEHEWHSREPLCTSCSS